MHFDSTAVDGVFVVRPERHADARGFFARIHCEREFEAVGLPPRFVQTNLSFNRLAGTLRGMHFQWPPSAEGKLVRCVRGRLLDAVVDLRPESSSYLRSAAVELDADARNALFVPSGVAHGFQTLRDDTEVLYQMSDYHSPGLGAGYRFDDAAFGLRWPLTVTSIAERDAGYGDFEREAYEAELDRRRSGVAPENQGSAQS